jgi:alcohol dehydrogenase class IV
VIDPLLTVSMPPGTTATSGLDALTQVIEPFISNQANPLTDALCKEGMFRAARSLRAAFRDGSDTAAREDMCLTSLFGGLALANAKLGAVHGFAGPVGGMFDAPHGEICGILLPHVMEALESALSERAGASAALARLDETARILTGRPDARARDGVRWIRALTDALNLPSLSTFGITSADIDEIVRRAKSSSSMKGSPVMLTDTELSNILAAALNG